MHMSSISAASSLHWSKLPLQRIDVKPLDVKRTPSLISNYLDDEDCEHLFWALSRDQTYASRRWLKQKDRDATFDKFWFGMIEEANSCDIRNIDLKQVQDGLRTEDRLPGMLGVVTILCACCSHPDVP